nr:hypothetical protein OG690_10385 [Streptomyces tubercidicus]
MTNTNQDFLTGSEDDPITQSDAFRLLGTSRAVLRGFIDRGTLSPVDHHGTRGAARLRLGDVMRLKEALAGNERVPSSRPASETAAECRSCAAKDREHERTKQDLARAVRALNAALGL